MYAVRAPIMRVSCTTECEKRTQFVFLSSSKSSVIEFTDFFQLQLQLQLQL